MKTWADKLRYLASYNVRYTSEDVFLRRWWTGKYNKSHKSDEFQRYTKMELFLEFFEDVYEKDSQKMREFLDEVGDHSTPSSGDELMDKFEEQLARGETPDIDQMFPEHLKEKFGSTPASESKESGIDSLMGKMDQVVLPEE